MSLSVTLVLSLRWKWRLHKSYYCLIGSSTSVTLTRTWMTVCDNVQSMEKWSLVWSRCVWRCALKQFGWGWISDCFCWYYLCSASSNRINQFSQMSIKITMTWERHIQHNSTFHVIKTEKTGVISSPCLSAAQLTLSLVQLGRISIF